MVCVLLASLTNLSYQRLPGRSQLQLPLAGRLSNEKTQAFDRIDIHEALYQMWCVIAGDGSYYRKRFVEEGDPLAF